MWAPRKIKKLNRFLNQGGSVSNILESFHWRWDNKVFNMQTNPNQRGFSLVSEGITEAMMIVDLSKTAKLKTGRGKPIVYVE